MLVIVFLLLTVFAQKSSWNKDDAFCGDDNCYDLLGVPHDSNMTIIKGRYRELSKENHPDKLKAKGLPQDEIDKRTDFMQRINVANDVLSSKARRADYDTMLKVRMQMDAPKENEWIVLLGIFFIITFLVDYYRKSEYESVKKALLKQPRIKSVFDAKENVKTAGMSKKELKAYKKQRKEQRDNGEENLDDYDDAVINKVIKEGGLKVFGWTGGKPNFVGAMMVVAKSPLTIGLRLFYNCFWLFRFATGSENDHDRKMDMISKLGFTEEFWDGLNASQQAQYKKQLQAEEKATKQY